VAAGAAWWPLARHVARADEAPYPNHPIRAVPFGTAGGPIDGISRIYGDKLQQRWGQPVVVDPRPGASGVIAANAVAKAAPAGYTWLVTLPLTHINEAILHANLPYDPVRDLGLRSANPRCRATRRWRHWRATSSSRPTTAASAAAGRP